MCSSGEAVPFPVTRIPTIASPPWIQSASAGIESPVTPVNSIARPAPEMLVASPTPRVNGLSIGLLDRLRTRRSR